MGLDMYLERCDRKVWGYKNFDLDVIKGEKPDLYNELKPYIVQRGKNFYWESLFEEVGYWRKANAIHRWFVENVQDGVDDCGKYEVEKEKLEELLAYCKEDLEDMSRAKELLPTMEGFFFGSTEYDEWYFEDIKDTIKILEKVLEETDFDRQMITYQSSW